MARLIGSVHDCSSLLQKVPFLYSARLNWKCLILSNVKSIKAMRLTRNRKRECHRLKKGTAQQPGMHRAYSMWVFPLAKVCSFCEAKFYLRPIAAILTVQSIQYIVLNDVKLTNIAAVQKA